MVQTDLEKVVNRPQAENSEVYNVLKIVRFMTKDKQKYVYQIVVWHNQILKSPSPYLKYLLSNLNSPCMEASSCHIFAFLSR